MTRVTWALIAAAVSIFAARQGLFAPTAPTLFAEPGSATEAMLVWHFEPGYRFAQIEVSTKDANLYHVLARIDGHSNTLLKSNLQPNVSYSFRARACVRTVCSRYSNDVVVRVR